MGAITCGISALDANLDAEVHVLETREGRKGIQCLCAIRTTASPLTGGSLTLTLAVADTQCWVYHLDLAPKPRRLTEVKLKATTRAGVQTFALSLDLMPGDTLASVNLVKPSNCLQVELDSDNAGRLAVNFPLGVAPVSLKLMPWSPQARAEPSSC